MSGLIPLFSAVIISFSGFDDTAGCSFTSMGTVIKVFSQAKTPQACTIVKRVFEKVDGLMSIFHPSDIFSLNQMNGNWVRVSPETFLLLKKAREICKKSGGYFNPLLGKWKKMWQEVEMKQTSFSPEKIERVLRKSSCTCSDIAFKGKNKVKVKRGCEVDLGGIAKGYALDLSKRELLKNGIQSSVVDAGGDVLLMKASPSYVGIKDPIIKRRIKAIVEESGFEFVCTSGGYERYFKLKGEKYPHIFNPLAGSPARYFLSVTAFAHRGYLCDALATAIFAGGERALLQVMHWWKGKVKAIVIKRHEN